MFNYLRVLLRSRASVTSSPLARLAATSVMIGAFFGPKRPGVTGHPFAPFCLSESDESWGLDSICCPVRILSYHMTKNV